MKARPDKRTSTKTYSGKYHVKNPDRYKGNHNDVIYRSQWEKACFMWLDDHKEVKWWNSEEFVVRYFYEVDQVWRRYHVDLAIKWKNGKTLLVEVKPKKQCQPPKVKRPKSKRSLNEAFAWVMNCNKWEAADKIAKDNGWEFVIWTEDELKQFGILKKQPGRLNPLPRYSKKKKLT